MRLGWCAIFARPARVNLTNNKNLIQAVVKHIYLDVENISTNKSLQNRYLKYVEIPSGLLIELLSVSGDRVW